MAIPSQLKIIAKHLQPFIGDLAEEFIAVELFKINRDCINYQQSPRSLCEELAEIGLKDLQQLLRHINEVFERIVGANYAGKIVARIIDDLRQQCPELGTIGLPS